MKLTKKTFLWYFYTVRGGGMNSKLFVNFSENIQSKYAFYMLVQLEEKKLTENVVNVLCIYSSVIKKKLQLALLLKK
jgi:hypothetical protein